MTIILASGSAVRGRLLRNAGVAFEAYPAQISEEAWFDDLPTPMNRETTGVLAGALAEAKALDVSRRLAEPEGVYVGADQILLFGDAALQKVQTREAARVRLQAMRNREHDLVTSCVIAIEDRVVWRHLEITQVKMREYSDEDLEIYCDKAGDALFNSVSCYEIEGLGALLIKSINGDYFSALGLPLFALMGELRRIEAPRRWGTAVSDN